MDSLWRLKVVARIKMEESELVDGFSEERFELFWSMFERNAETAIANEVSVRSNEFGRDGSDYCRQNSGCSGDNSIDSRIPSLPFFRNFLVPFALGFFLALFLVIR